MALKLIKTKNAAFVVDEVQDDVREKMGILFGRAIHRHPSLCQKSANCCKSQRRDAVLRLFLKPSCASLPEGQHR